MTGNYFSWAAAVARRSSKNGTAQDIWRLTGKSGSGSHQRNGLNSALGKRCSSSCPMASQRAGKLSKQSSLPSASATLSSRRNRPKLLPSSTITSKGLIGRRPFSTSPLSSASSPSGTGQTPASASGDSKPYKPHPAELSNERYSRVADAYLDGLSAALDELVEEREDVDFEMSQGVLRLDFPPNGTYVINKQPPNRQIWLSSPVSGPKRYDWVESETEGETADWVYLRDGSTMNQLLGEELGIDTEPLWTENLDVDWSRQ